MASPQFFLETVELLIKKNDRSTNLKTAELLEAIATCIRAMAKSDPALASAIWTGIKLCRGEASLRVARILERFATDIRLEATRQVSKNPSYEVSKTQSSAGFTLKG